MKLHTILIAFRENTFKIFISLTFTPPAVLCLLQDKSIEVHLNRIPLELYLMDHMKRFNREGNLKVKVILPALSGVLTYFPPFTCGPQKFSNFLRYVRLLICLCVCLCACECAAAMRVSAGPRAKKYVKHFGPSLRTHSFHSRTLERCEFVSGLRLIRACNMCNL